MMALETVSNILAVIIEIELLIALYFGYGVLRNMRRDLKYSATRIFLSPDAVRGIKVLLITLLGYTVVNTVAVFRFQGELLDMVLRVILFGLFAGFAYFLYQIYSVTCKPDR